jgi:ubiquinone/menaquinone biosynthesis C-methylase UbiE
MEEYMSTRNNITTTKPISKASKGYKGLAMEGFIASWYAKNRQRDIAEFKSLARRLAESAADGSAVLEIAPGPGYLSIELAKLGNYQITGLDISKSFVEMAQKNAKEARVAINFRQGDAAQMPFGDDIFNFIVCTAAFKNFSEPVQALIEMNRVLKPNGKALIIDLRRDASQEEIKKLVDNMELNWIDSLITKWTFKYMLIKRAYTQDEIREFVSKTKFRNCDIQETLVGLEISLEK